MKSFRILLSNSELTEYVRKKEMAGNDLLDFCSIIAKSIKIQENEIKKSETGDDAMKFELTPQELAELNKATFNAFLETGRYAFSQREAYKQFGDVNIDLLIANNLLNNTSELMGKKKFLLSDIINAQYLWRKLTKRK